MAAHGQTLRVAGASAEGRLRRRRSLEYVRYGGDYDLATSSFAYFPGIPIHHRRDLLHWRLVGYALTDTAHLQRAGGGLSAGLWSPTLRCQAGRFYLVTTNMTKGGNLLVTAERPEGLWSPPVFFDPKGWDPSLLFDDDGKVYLSCTCSTPWAARPSSRR